MDKEIDVRMHGKPQISASEIPVYWAASGEHVFQTPISDFEKAVKRAKEQKTINWQLWK